MKAFIRTQYGGPEVLRLEEVEKPVLREDRILVKVMANSVNPADWHILRGEPIMARFAFGLFQPKHKIIGADFAGVVEQVGNKVKGFNIGDKVYGESLKDGAFAEYICPPPNVCARIPENSDFQSFAGMPVAGLTALQALVTHGKLKEGESVLINGASGGVGHLCVQIAKAYGARVTGVCSGKNVALVKSLGADEVIAYDKESIYTHSGNYDLVVDTHGNLFLEDFKRMGKRGVVIGFTGMRHMMWLILKSSLSRFPLVQFTAEANTTDLETLAALVQDGKLKVHLDKIYPYQEIPQAITYIEKMRTRGKVVMQWNDTQTMP